jgi:hypothetical protein
MVQGGILGGVWDKAFSATGARYANSYPYIVQTVGAGNQAANAYTGNGFTWNSYASQTYWSFIANNASNPDHLFEFYWPNDSQPENWYFGIRASAPTPTAPGGTIAIGGRAGYQNPQDAIIHLQLGADCVGYNSVTQSGSSITIGCGYSNMGGNSGVVIIPANFTSITVTNTAVTASSRIFIQPTTDSAANAPGQALVCSPPASGWAYPTSRIAGVSFTFTVPANTASSCWQFWVVN